MKILFKILQITGVVALVLIVGMYFYLQHIKPVYKGEMKIAGLGSEVEVWFDNYGIPHIYAQNKEDLYKVLGYVHAQERLWQMELVRRIAPGRLSEILGKDLLETDKFFRTLGIHISSKKAAADLQSTTDSPMYREASAYLAGINEYVANGPTPLEYTLLGVEKTPFTLEDVYNAVGYMSFSFAAAHKTDPLVNHIYTQLGADYLRDLGIYGDSTREIIPSYVDYEQAGAAISANILKILDRLPASPFIGSNSWVLAPSRTTSGKVLFANDPHIGFSQPAVWYEAYLQAPGFELYGYYLAGYPFAILGHNRKMAVGLTMLENDDVDFYSETPHPTDPTKYKVKDAWVPFVTRDEVIKVKSESDVLIKVKSTGHGPIVNEVLGERAGEQPLAMWSVYNMLDNKLLHATYRLNNAKSIDDVSDAASQIFAPGLNVMYGDADGKIGWWATAKLVKRPAHVNSFVFLNGAEGADDPVGYYLFEENPHAVDPPSGYVYSANNQPDSIDGYLYPGYYMPEDRARRIKTLLDANGKWDMEGFKKMLLDENSPVATELAGILAESVDEANLGTTEKRALSIVAGWDGSFAADAIAPTIYSRWIYEVMNLAMHDELDSANFALFLSTDLRKRTLARLLNNPESVWWDNTTTAQRETREDIISDAFVATVAFLEEDLGTDVERWRWEAVHTLTHNHALGIVPLLGKLLNVGAFAASSGEEVINNLGYSISGTGRYPVTFGPSTRRVIDFADIENSESILPTGQSGVISSEHYDDQAEMFVKGEFRKMILKKEELISGGRLLRFSSGNKN